MAKTFEDEVREAGLDPNVWKPIDSPPLIPSERPPAPDKSMSHLVGSLPLSSQLEPSFIESGTGGRIPKLAMMPLAPSGQPPTNSGAQSTVQGSAAFQGVQTQTAANTNQITTNTQQIATLQATSFQGDWASDVSYSQGASVVGSDSKIYISLINANLGNDPTTSPTDWTATGGTETFAGTYSGSVTYSIGQIVEIVSSGQLFISLANSNLNHDPTSTSGFWQVLNPSTIAAYSGTTTYFVNSLVTFGGGVFAALQTTTGNSPATPPTSNSFWEYVGPSSLTIVPDGSSRFAATGSGLSYRPATNPLTATDAGSNATVSIASFTMQTSANGAISENSGSVTTSSYGTLYYIYFSDPTLAGGAVTYLATTSKTTALNGNGNFYVGSILTPISGGIQTTGFGDGGVGNQNGGATIYLGGLTTVSTTGAGGTVTNPNNAIDGNITSFADVKTTFSTSASQNAQLLITGFPAIQVLTQATLYIRSSGSCNFTGSGTTGDAELDYSLNGGGSFSSLYALNTNGSSHALDTQTVSLAIGQNLALIQVKAFTNGSITISGTVTTEIKLYEAWIDIVN